MSNTLQEMTLDLQTRIRELAYLMWETAGRQQGMAIEYWLKAESEVLTAMEAAAVRMMPGSPAASRPAGAGMSASPAREVPVAPEVAAAAPMEAPAARGSASPEETRITAGDTPLPEPAPAPRQKAKPATRGRTGRAAARKDATA